MSSINPAGQCCSTGSKISSFSGGTPVTPANAYVLENGTTFYVAEDGSTFYVQEV